MATSQTSSSPSQTSSSPSQVSLQASELAMTTCFVLTIEDEKILKDKYLNDFETGDQDLCKQVIGNAVKELGMLRPEDSVVDKRNATMVCATY
jgi:hypothetical protein